MTQPYLDIIQKLGMPVWYSEGGIPRYCDPHPTIPTKWKKVYNKSDEYIYSYDNPNDYMSQDYDEDFKGWDYHYEQEGIRE